METKASAYDEDDRENVMEERLCKNASGMFLITQIIAIPTRVEWQMAKEVDPYV